MFWMNRAGELGKREFPRGESLGTTGTWPWDLEAVEMQDRAARGWPGNTRGGHHDHNQAVLSLTATSWEPHKSWDTHFLHS